uniref:Uncharacterized protein n=1 Tax=Craspedostauros australis TaxID=1486917 RepID=A0A7R9WVN3_9STRA|mmetsp:Transcript_21645/g.60248  ORF Transcript_21645/g.60248 Transcript_21645/m.60248 type:complete len:117 (+) Transcript_21645:58-408(+)
MFVPRDKQQQERQSLNDRNSESKKANMQSNNPQPNTQTHTDTNITTSSTVFCTQAAIWCATPFGFNQPIFGVPRRDLDANDKIRHGTECQSTTSSLTFYETKYQYQTHTTAQNVVG